MPVRMSGPTTMTPATTTMPSHATSVDATPGTTAAMNRSAKPILVIVDPMSTGAALAENAHNRGMLVFCVWSDVCPESLRHFVAEGQPMPFVGETTHNGNLKDTIAALYKVGTVGEVIVGSEPGVELADALAHALGLRGNGIEQSSTRRNKFAQTEAIRSKGLSAGAQSLVMTLDHVDDFLLQHCCPFSKAVVKPVDGAASEGVTIAETAEQVRHAFLELQGTTNVFGRTNREGAQLSRIDCNTHATLRPIPLLMFSHRPNPRAPLARSHPQSS